MSSRTLVVIGGGLAGLSAALQAARVAASAASRGGARVDVVLLEKASQVGGNSAKASSGISALTPETGDDEALFEADTLRSGGGRSSSALMHTLVVRGAHIQPDRHRSPHHGTHLWARADALRRPPPLASPRDPPLGAR
jgi:succinate dehydrogenase/fumarate reductase flavoprotein subunit